MSQNGPSNYGFENLTQSDLMKIPCKDNKELSLSFGTFNGNTGFTIFTGAGGKPWKQNIPRKVLANIVILLTKMKAAPNPCREAIFLNEWIQETKQRKQVGSIGIGIDENLTLYIDIAHNELFGGTKHLFPIKQDGRYDFSNTSLSEKEALLGSLNWMIESFGVSSAVAERLSSYKRQPGQGGGNRNFGGGGNKGNYGGGNGGGGGGSFQGNRQNQSSGGSFGGPDVENDLHLM